MKSSILFGALLFCAGCSEVEEPTPPVTHHPSPAHPETEGRSKTIELQTRGVRHGATNFDPNGLQKFVVPFGVRFEVLEEDLERRARYVDSAGATTPCQVGREIGVTPAESSLTIAAAEPLKSNAWHWLVVDVDDALSVQDPDLPATPAGGRWSTHFFTGSAPHVIGVEVPTGEKAGAPIRVNFSEPINLGEVAGDRLIYSGKEPISKCILRGSECFTGDEWMSAAADVPLTVSVLPETLTFVLAGKVTGSGKTVSQSRSVTRQVDTMTDGLRWSVARTEFRDVRGTSLWVDRLPPPALR